MAQCDWYLAPRLDRVKDPEDPDIYEYVGPASNGLPHLVPNSTCRANNPAGANVLVGVLPGTSVPGDWVAKTVAEAATHFESVVGRAPVGQEVT